MIHKESVKKRKLNEKDFTYGQLKKSIEGLRNFLQMYYDEESQGEKMDWAISHISMPNKISILKGCSLFLQREVVALRLENAKLKREPKLKLLGLQLDLDNIEKEIKKFIDTTCWID